MEITTLKDCPIEEILNAFNGSFADYFVPLQLTQEQMTNKIRSELVDLNLSVGAFEGGELVGFILNAYNFVDGRKLVYNAGTGVLPAHRNQALTKRMYNFILPEFWKANIDAGVLEVITENIPAISIYEKVGFARKRKLTGYKGLVKSGASTHYTIRDTGFNWETMKTFWDFTPTWQNSISVIEQLKDTVRTYGAFDGEGLAGYILYNPVSKRVLQFGVDKKYRGKGIASALFAHIANGEAPVTIINVDEGSPGTNAFLLKIGLQKFIEQYEMVLDMSASKFEPLRH